MTRILLITGALLLPSSTSTVFYDGEECEASYHIDAQELARRRAITKDLQARLLKQSVRP